MLTSQLALVASSRGLSAFMRQLLSGTSLFDVEAIRQSPNFATDGITIEMIGRVTDVTESVGTSIYRVASSTLTETDHLVGNEYDRMRNILSDVADVQFNNKNLGIAIHLPAVKIVQSVYFDVIGLGPLYLIGETDEFGEPATMLKANFPVYAENATSDEERLYTQLWMKNIRLGAYPEDMSAMFSNNDRHDGSVMLYSGGGIVLDNCRVFGNKDDGLGSDNVFIKPKRESGRFWVYDSVIGFSGRQGTKHNLYIHAIGDFRFVRSVSMRPRHGHAIKIECDRAAIIDSFISNSAHYYNGSWDFDGVQWNNAFPIDTTRHTDILLLNSVVHWKDSDRTNDPKGGINQQSRRNAWGGFSLKMPPVFVPSSAWNDRFDMKWLSGRSGDDTKTDVRSFWTNGTIQQGDTTLPITRFGHIGETEYSTNSPKLNDRFTVRLLLKNQSDEVIHETGATVTDPGSGGNNVVLEMDEPIPIAFDEMTVCAKPEAVAWDKPILNPAFWNPDDPDYYWPKIDDGAGELNYTSNDAQQHFHAQWITECMFLSGWNAAGDCQLMRTDGTPNAEMYIGTGRRPALFPLPPMNAPDGSWTVGPDAADFDFVTEQFAIDRTFFGTQGVSTDYVHPFFTGMRNIGTAKRPNSVLPDITVSHFIDAVGMPPPREQVVVELQPDASVRRIDSANNTPPAVAATPTVSGAHSTGTTSLTVDDATGVQVGTRVHVRFEPKAGTVQMQATQITAVAGTTLTLADPLARDLAGGEEAAIFTPAGAKPPWWNDGVA